MYVSMMEYGETLPLNPPKLGITPSHIRYWDIVVYAGWIYTHDGGKQHKQDSKNDPMKLLRLFVNVR